MLRFMRDRAQGVFAWIFVVIITLAFGLVGLNAYLGGDGKVIVATVDDVEIPVSIYQRAYQQERAFRQQILGDRFDPAFLDAEILKREAIDRIVNSEVIAQTSFNAGLRISDVQLADRIRAIRQFQRDGRFDQGLYIRLLNNQGQSEESFEEKLRRDLLADQLMTAVMDSELVVGAEVERLLALQDQQRSFSYLTLAREDYVKGVKVSDDDARAYYEEHRNRYAIPEQMSIEYIELASADLENSVEPDEMILKKMYDDQALELGLPEERRASHILLQLDDDASDDDERLVREKAESLLKQIRDGVSFASLAKEHSSDPGSAAQGGDLDYFARGVMMASFEKAAFSMAIGDVSEPVRSPFGYHIIKLTDIRKEQRKPFAEVRESLAKEYRAQKAEEQFFELADMLSDLTFEYPDSLQVAAEELDLTIKSTPMFDRQRGLGIATDRKVRDVSFSGDVLDAGNNSAVITLSDTRVVVLRKKQHEVLSYKQFDQVKAQIIASVKQQRAQESLNKTAQDVVTQLVKGKSQDAAAATLKAKWKIAKAAGRNEASVSRDVLSLVFRMTAPSDDAPVVYDGVELNNGGYVIVALQAVSQPEGEASDDDKKMARDMFIRRYANQLGGHLLESMKAAMDVRVYPERI